MIKKCAVLFFLKEEQHGYKNVCIDYRFTTNPRSRSCEIFIIKSPIRS